MKLSHRTKKSNLLKTFSAVAILSLASGCATGGSEGRFSGDTQPPQTATASTESQPPKSSAAPDQIPSRKIAAPGKARPEEMNPPAQERFIDEGNGTIKDTRSGLVWTKDADCFGKQTWQESAVACQNLASGQCGLSDASNAGEWRLPTKQELKSLVDRTKRFPSLPEGHPFLDVEPSYYWTSTDCNWDERYVWTSHLGLGGGVNGKKTNRFYTWCVRDRR